MLYPHKTAAEQENRTELGKLDAATERRDAVRAKHDALRKQRLDEFMAGFSVISMRLKEMYQMITLGGDAELDPGFGRRSSDDVHVFADGQ